MDTDNCSQCGMSLPNHSDYGAHDHCPALDDYYAASASKESLGTCSECGHEITWARKHGGYSGPCGWRVSGSITCGHKCVVDPVPAPNEKRLIGCINTAANAVWHYADQYSGVLVADHMHKMVVDAFKSMTHAFDHVTARVPPSPVPEHVAWLHYVNHGQHEDSGADILTVETCDSDAEGAFKVYAIPPPDAEN